MLFSRYSNNHRRHRAWLYSVVFAGRFSVLLVFLLLASFIVQPLHQALASGPAPDEVPPPVANDVKPQENPDTSTPASTAPTTEASTTTSAQPTTEPTATTSTHTEGTASSTEPTGTTTPTSGDGAAPEKIISVEATTTTIIDGKQVETQRVKTTDGEVLKVESLVNDQNFYQFSKQSCIEVGNGVFNCTSRKDVDTNQDSVVYTERDQGGDMEIYLKTSRGIEKKITDNDFEDTEPSYDPASMRIVWQRLIEGRTQIMMYDIMEGKETQLTFSKTNNMQPKVSEAGIVWQAWDNNDWEIMYFDGVHTTQITDNDVQDVAPVIQDGYILWNVLGSNTQQARVYSLATKETVSIKGYEGGSIKNPRFVLVYDTEMGNGDVITQTFDPSTGLSKPVAAKPAPQPVNIPNTDPTGQIRALIQGKTQKDDKELKLLDAQASSSGNGTGSPTDAGTLNLHSASSSVDMSMAAVIVPSPDFELTEYDLVIPQNALSEALASSSDSGE